MESINRKPFQGLSNIVRFNWHFYLIAFVFIAALLFFKAFLSPWLEHVAALTALFIMISVVLSLAASWYIHDRSDLYTLNWLNALNNEPGMTIVNINAGFDETSTLLLKNFPACTLSVFDFYDPAKHTEISIERARKAYPPFPGTKTISTGNIPLQANTADYIFLVLSAHEIRNDAERIDLFKQLNLAIKPGGKIIVVEHQRDLVNFIAYNFGFFHFFSNSTWKKTFKAAMLTEETETKLTPFLSIFILAKNGTAA